MKKDGFTLVELLVVLAIFGLMLTLAVPLFQKAIPSASTRSATRELAAALREARSLAIYQNRETVITIDGERRTYGLGDQGTTKRLGKVTVAFAPNLEEEATPEVAAVRFFPDGSSTGGEIRISSGGGQYRVVVDWLTGHVEILD